MNYILVAAIKEQQQMIEELTKRLDDQSTELSRIQAAMAQLQAAEQTD